jgi:hypothetical protein
MARGCVSRAVTSAKPIVTANIRNVILPARRWVSSLGWGGLQLVEVVRPVAAAARRREPQAAASDRPWTERAVIVTVGLVAGPHCELESAIDSGASVASSMNKAASER